MNDFETKLYLQGSVAVH